jgi:hypothetical protein
MNTNQARDKRGESSRVVMAAALAALLTITACEDNLAPQFKFTGTGDVEGLVFYDAVEDGVYDPASGDVPLAGVSIAIQDRGTGQTYSGGTATSGADGRFTVTGMPAGTHDLLIDTLTVQEGVSICQNPLQVTVNIEETRFSEIRGRPGCLISIAEAKETPAGTFVIVRGIVTSSPNQIDPNFSFIQDETAGARIFSSALTGLDPEIEVGDQLEIGATSGAFSGDFNFENVVFRALVEDVGEISPLLTTTAEIGASGSDFTHPLQGAFIRIEKAELTAAFGAGGANSQNGTIDDGSGAITIRVNDGVAPPGDLNTIFTVGACYNIAGFGANFLGAGQIFPRSLDDIQEVPCN